MIHVSLYPRVFSEKYLTFRTSVGSDCNIGKGSTYTLYGTNMMKCSFVLFIAKEGLSAAGVKCHVEAVFGCSQSILIIGPRRQVKTM